MLKLFVIILTLKCIGQSCLAQSIQSNDLDSLGAVIKDAYAGYKDKVKGDEFDVLLQQVKRSKSKDTFALLSRLTAYFKDHHLMLFDYNIRKQKIDTQQCKRDSQIIHRYFANKRPKAEYEGFWLSDFNYCIIALKKVSSNPVTYHGYVMETTRKAIPGSCILKMTLQNDGTYFTDYTEEGLAYRLFLHSKFKNKNTLLVNSFGGIWRRISNYKQGTLAGLTQFSFKPTFDVIDEKTVLLKMPDFGSENIEKYDSLIKANVTRLENATTLIVDIRHNTGGTINNYLPLLPYIYTNPILHSGGYDLYSNLYIKNYESTIKKYLAKGDTVNANIYIDYFDSVKAKKGQFDYTGPDTLAKDLPVLANPKNVAVLINNNCLSAAELMLLNFKQSRKVKLFGERTGGAVDYLNALTLPISSRKYSLFIATVKREITPQQPSYDGKGIVPDVEISDDVSDWVAFVKKYYDEHQQ